MWTALGAVALVTVGAFVVAPGGGGRPALDPEPGIVDQAAADELGLRKQTDHLVDKQMLGQASGLVGKTAPVFSLPDSNGKTVSSESLKGRPYLLYFIERECPCCLGAKVFVDDLARMYGDRVKVLAVINGDAAQAKTWIKATAPKFDLLCDPSLDTMRGFEAQRGVYSVLVDAEGRIDAVYPGYSFGALRSAGARMAELAGVEEVPYAPTLAPETMTSGCLFPGYDTP